LKPLEEASPAQMDKSGRTSGTGETAQDTIGKIPGPARSGDEKYEKPSRNWTRINAWAAVWTTFGSWVTAGALAYLTWLQFEVQNAQILPFIRSFGGLALFNQG